MTRTPPATRSRTTSKPVPRSRPGMTLIELMVAVSIMVIMILFFGMILNSSDQVVRVSQSKMRADRAAAAIASVIRQDLLRASKTGFFTIASSTNDDNYTHDILIFGAPGVYPSLLESDKVGAGAVVSYGVAPNGNTEYASEEVLYRQAWALLGPQVAGYSPVIVGDTWDYDYAYLQTLTASEPYNRMIGRVADEAQKVAAANIAVPPTNLTQLDNSWKVLAKGCSNLRIDWYANSGWRNAATDSDAVTSSSWGFRYRMWTRHDQSTWPEAVRIRFTVNDDTLPEEFQNTVYEVICPVGVNQ